MELRVRFLLPICQVRGADSSRATPLPLQPPTPKIAIPQLMDNPIESEGRGYPPGPPIGIAWGSLAPIQKVTSEAKSISLESGGDDAGGNMNQNKIFIQTQMLVLLELLLLLLLLLLPLFLLPPWR